MTSTKTTTAEKHLDALDELAVKLEALDALAASLARTVELCPAAVQRAYSHAVNRYDLNINIDGIRRAGLQAYAHLDLGELERSDRRPEQPEPEQPEQLDASRSDHYSITNTLSGAYLGT